MRRKALRRPSSRRTCGWAAAQWFRSSATRHPGPHEEIAVSNAAALLQSYPGTMNLDKGLLATAIDEALTCFQTCTE